MTTDSSRLQEFGLSAKEAATYFALIELGSSTITPIARQARIKRTTVYNFIERLVALGLVTKVMIRGRARFQAANPERLIELQKERLDLATALVPMLKEHYDRSPKRVKFHYFQGPDEILNILKEESRCKREALYIWPGKESLDAVGGAKAMAEIDRKRIKAGVWVRTIRFRKADVRFRSSAHGRKFFRELRWAPPGIQLRMGMGIYDTGKVGFFSSPRENFGFLVESEELTQLMRTLYKLLWAASAPASEGEG